VLAFRGAYPASEIGKRKRRTLLWALVFLIGGQLGLTSALSFWPQLQDPEIGGKLANLTARLAEKPSRRPLVLALGTSHVGMAVRPDALPGCRPGSSELPLVFNLSVNGGDFLVDCVCLRRVLAKGIHPDWVVVEAWPLMLMNEGKAIQVNESMSVLRVRWQDFTVLSQYFGRPKRLYQEWFRIRLLPWYWYRYYLLSRFVPDWLPQANRVDCIWNNLDAWGWQWVPGHVSVDPDTYRRRIESLQYQYTTGLKGFRVSDAADRLVRNLILTCRENQIAIALIRMPEASQIRSCYPPEVGAELSRYFSRLTQELATPVIDAHDWVDDSGFSDGHHLTPTGATTFMRRFEREFLQPIMAGQSPCSSCSVKASSGK
jgi:hypothetical protein